MMEFENALPRLQILDSFSIQRIYFSALEVLERTGVAVQHSEALELLKQAGATVENEVAHIPSETWQPDLFDRDRYEDWKGRGGRDLTERAKERIMSLLSEPKSIKLKKHQTDEFAKIIKRREGKNQVRKTAGE